MKIASMIIPLSIVFLSSCGGTDLFPSPIPTTDLALPLNGDPGIGFEARVGQYSGPTVPIGQSTVIIGVDLTATWRNQSGEKIDGSMLEIAGDHELTFSVNGRLFQDEIEPSSVMGIHRYTLKASVPAENDGYDILISLSLGAEDFTANFTVPGLALGTRSSGGKGYHYLTDTLDITWDAAYSDGLSYEIYLSEHPVVSEGEALDVTEDFQCDFGPGIDGFDNGETLAPVTITPESDFRPCTRSGTVAPMWTYIWFQKAGYIELSKSDMHVVGFTDARARIKHIEQHIVLPVSDAEEAAQERRF